MALGILAYNPTAGRFPSGILAERAANVLREYGWQIQLEQTLSGKHIKQLARQAAEKGMDAIFIAGGDGSLNHAAAGLVDTETALGVLPAGTANVFAQELGLSGLSWTRRMALEESAKRLALASTRHMDVGFCNNHIFLLWAGIGLDAFVVHRIEPRTRLEKQLSAFHYTASAVWHASFWRGINLQVEIDESQIRGHFLLALASNIRLYAGGMATVSPNARLDDGVMDLWLFEGDTLADTVQLAWEIWSGQHVESDNVHRLSIQQAHLESDSPMYIQVDAEPLEEASSVDIQIRNRALKVLVPEPTPHLLFDHNSA